MKKKILFVEDEVDLGTVITQYLEMMDLEVDRVTNAYAAVEKMASNAQAYCLAMLDVSLPGMDGFELSQKLTTINPKLPFLFLTARTEKKDKLQGLKIGAEDYVTKPFDIDELVLRIQNIIKRNQEQPLSTQPTNTTTVRDVKFHKETMKLVVGNNEATLTVREAELLEYLFNHQNQVLKREEILLQLWGENDYFMGRSLDVFISRLRKHLSKSTHIHINNVYGVGFMFEVKEN
jgi:DNA-binding response OmpR family regulator